MSHYAREPGDDPSHNTRRLLTPEDALHAIMEHAAIIIYNGGLVAMLGFDDGTELTADERDIAEVARQKVLDMLGWQ